MQLNIAHKNKNKLKSVLQTEIKIKKSENCLKVNAILKNKITKLFQQTKTMLNKIKANRCNIQIIKFSLLFIHYYKFKYFFVIFRLKLKLIKKFKCII